MFQYGLNLALANAVSTNLPYLPQLLIKIGASPSTLHEGTPLLHIAMANKNYDLAEKLIESGHDIEAIDRFGHTALVNEFIYGDRTTVKFLLDFGANLKAESPNYGSAIFIALNFYNVEMVEFAAEKGLIDGAKFRGMSPLQTLISSKSLKITAFEQQNLLKLLLKNGVDVNEMILENGNGALHEAILHSPNLVRTLLKCGAEFERRNKNELSPTHLIPETYYPAKTLYHFIEHGADLNAQDGMGRSLLHKLVASENPRRNEKAIEMILRTEPDLTMKDINGETPFFTAAKLGQTFILEMLWKFDKKQHMFVKERTGETPFLAAAANGFVETAHFLLKKGSFVDKTDRSDRCAMHFAAMNANYGLFEKLRQYGADPYVVDVSKYIPIEIAIINGDINFVKHMMKFDRYDNADLARLAINHEQEDIANLINGKKEASLAL